VGAHREEYQAAEIKSLKKALEQLTDVNRHLEQANVLLTTPPKSDESRDASEEDAAASGAPARPAAGGEGGPPRPDR